jgi:hypothetical protein
MPKNNFKNLIFIILGLLVSLSLHAQETSDSVILQYLRSRSDIPAPFLRNEKVGKETIRSQNFFSDPNKPIKFGSLTIRTFLFGSSESHALKYFLIEVKSTKQIIYKIIDKQTLEAGLRELFSFLRPYGLSGSKKAQILNQFSFAYY